MLTMLYDIKRLVCFKEQNNKEILLDYQKEEYNRTIFNLYKKNILEPTENGLKVSDEIKEIFFLLKNCHTMLTIETKIQAISGYCVYFGKKEYFVIMRPGSREGEYVKIEKLRKEYLKQFLTESNAVPEETISQEYLEYCKDFPLVGDEILNFLSQKGKKDWEKLYHIENTQTIIVAQEPATGKEIEYFAIIKQPMQDKILAINDTKSEVFSYSVKILSEVLENMLEVRHDIG